MNFFFAVVIAAIFLWVWVKLDKRQKHKNIETAFSLREPLSKEIFYHTFYKKKDIPFHVVTGVLKVLEEQFQVDVSRIRSHDDLSNNLSFFFEYDSMADVEIICALEDEFGITITNSEAQSISTIEQIIGFVSNKVESLRNV